MPKTTKKHQYPLFFFRFQLIQVLISPHFLRVSPHNVAELFECCCRAVREKCHFTEQFCNNSATTVEESTLFFEKNVSICVKTGQYESKRVKTCQYVSKQVNMSQNVSICVKTGQYGSKRVNMCHGVVFQ